MSGSGRCVSDVPLAALEEMEPVDVYLAFERGALTEDGWSDDDDYSRKKSVIDEKVATGRRGFMDSASRMARTITDPAVVAAASSAIQDEAQERAEYNRLKARESAQQRLRDEKYEAELSAEPDHDWVRRGASVLKTTEIPFLVHGRLHQVGIGQLSAQPYQGKTLVGIGLALSVANGLDSWMGYPIDNPGPVVYIAGEGGAAIQVHIDAWLKDNPGCTLDDFILVDEMPLDWTVTSSVGRLDRLIDGVMSDDEAPVLVVGDTQIDLAGMVDENTVAMGHVFRDMRRWAVGRDLFFLLMHHMGHTGNRGRGHSSQFAKADALATLDGSGGDALKKMEWTKVKGCPKPSRLESLQIRAVPDSSGAVIERVPAMDLVAKAATAETALERSIIEAVEYLTAVGNKRISKNKIRTAEQDGIKFVRGAQGAVNSRIDSMVLKGLLTADNDTYAVVAGVSK